jgi:uncharacterized protein with PQ loop repeat
MSLVATTGACLLAAATLPQAVRLVRTREADDFSWAFGALNFAGLALLAARSFVIEEWAFVAINTITTLFWGLVLLVKLAPLLGPADASGRPMASRRR